MSGDGPEDRGGRAKAPSDDDLSARLRSLETRLQGTRSPGAAGGPARASKPDGSSLGQAMRLSTEFVAGVIAGGILGWIFDRFLGTRPWGLMVFLVLGFLTGIYNVMRLTGFLGPPRERVGDRAGDRTKGEGP